MSSNSMPFRRWPFEAACAYYRDLDICPPQPAVRLIETLRDAAADLKFVGDSLDGHTWIDITAKKECSTKCPCNHLDHDFYAFVIIKTPASMTIHVRSRSLADKIQHALGSEIPHAVLPDSFQEKAVMHLDGLNLLKYSEELFEKLKDLRNRSTNDSCNDVVAEMELLVHGILSNGDIFDSYGHSNLVDAGQLPFERWKFFQNQGVNRQIDLLEEVALEPYCYDDNGVDEESAPHRKGSFDDDDYSTCCKIVASNQLDLDDALEDLIEQRGIQNRNSVEASNSATPPERLSYPTYAPEGWDASTGSKLHSQELDAMLLDQTLTKESDTTVLLEKIRLSSINFVQLLLNCNAYDTTALIEAVRLRSIDLVQLLLRRNADPNIIVSNTTALLEAIRFDSINLVQLLLSHNADPNIIVSDTTPLLEAVRLRSIDLVQLLLRRNADPNIIVSNTTALLEAIRFGSIDLVQLLLYHNADPNIFVAGQTALSLAATTVQWEPIGRLLIRKGTDVGMAMAILGHAKSGYTKKAYCQLARLEWLAQQCQVDPELLGDVSRGKVKAFRLRLAFRNEYEGAKKRWNQRLPGVDSAFVEDHRKAYQNALRVLRDLCNGTCDGKLSHLLHFLILAKSMACSSEGHSNSDADDFKSDLARWELLLGGELDRLAYRRAVGGLWGVSITTPLCVMPPWFSGDLSCYVLDHCSPRDPLAESLLKNAKWGKYGTYHCEYCYSDSGIRRLDYLFQQLSSWGGDTFERRKPEIFGEMALNLIYRWGGEHIRTSNHFGFLGTQKRWRERQVDRCDLDGKSTPPAALSELDRIAAENEGKDPPDRGPTGNENSNNTSSAEVEPPDRAAPFQSPWENMSLNISPAGSDAAKIAILMAGAIFTMIMAFLLAMRAESSAEGHHPSFGLTSCSPVNVQKHFLQVTVADLIGTIPICIRPASTMSESLSNAIETGVVKSFSELRSFIETSHEIQGTNMKSHLLSQLERMKPTSVMQRAYTFLYAYLGLGLSGCVYMTMWSLVDNTSSASTDEDKQEDREPPQPRPSEPKRAHSPTISAERSPKRTRLEIDTPGPNSSSTTSTSNASAASPHINTPQSQTSRSNSSDKKTYCDECQRDFKTTSNYGKHRKGPKHDNKRYPCQIPGCGADFLRNDRRLWHEKNAHPDLRPRLPGTFQ
ncbi:hypothetical protein QBC43DRAFT_306543 [Cladorrhinum sp. PSN259]|nr:hypothetical protein QBC43DRAFT_306543 [Cladorrhinum sp. PSN259]